VSNFPPIPARGFRVIDETNWLDYHYIGAQDYCLYLWERMSKVKVGEWNQYPTNGFIANLQIPVSCQIDNPYRYKHKIAAINYAATALEKSLGNLREGTFVPMPPSKTQEHPEHDDRLMRVLQRVAPPLEDVRELVLLLEDVDSKQKGLTPEDRAAKYYVDENVAEPEPCLIIVFDDVITTGSHFKAVERVLRDRFPEASIMGLFLARAVRPDEF